MFLLFALLLAFSTATQCAEEPQPLTPRSQRKLGLHYLQQEHYPEFQKLFGLTRYGLDKFKAAVPKRDKVSFTAIAAGLGAIEVANDLYQQKTPQTHLYGMLLAGALAVDGLQAWGHNRKLNIVMDDFLQRHANNEYNRLQKGFMTSEEFARYAKKIFPKLADDAPAQNHRDSDDFEHVEKPDEKEEVQ